MERGEDLRQGDDDENGEQGWVTKAELGQRNWNRAIDGWESQAANSRARSAAIRNKASAVDTTARERGLSVGGAWIKNRDLGQRSRAGDLEQDFDRYAKVRERGSGTQI